MPPGTMDRSRWLARSAALLALLVVLSLGGDPAAYLGTDTGGKTATLEAMIGRGDWSPDVGYWAGAFDPAARYHPLYGTTPQGDRWVQVTTLPMLLAARPLYELGGYRLALLLPMLGTVSAALGAAAVARRIGNSVDEARAFWVVGAASPLVIYGLDLWEHSLGVAAGVWAAALLLDAVGGLRARAIGAGALLAAAATMRTEALAYTAVLVGIACIWAWTKQGLRPAVLVGIAAVVGFAPVWMGNVLLERAVGGNDRTGRATGAASAGVGDWSSRLDEGLRTTFSLAATDTWVTVALGVLLATGVAAVSLLGDRIPDARLPTVAVLLGLGTVLTVAPGLGFVPGFVAAFPVAAAGIAAIRHGGAARLLGVGAVLALPVVWAFQFLGGAGPQWGGRYVLLSAVLLGTLGVVALGRSGAPPTLLWTVVGMCGAVTAMGVGWLWERTHEVAGLFPRIVAVQEEVLVARNPFFLREAGPVALEHRWLSAADPDDLDGPAQVVAAAGYDRFSVLQLADDPTPHVAGAEVIGTDEIDALGVGFVVVHLAFDP